MDLIVLLFMIVFNKLEVKNKNLYSLNFVFFLVGINAWQALEIVFLFLTTSALIIIVASSIFYRFQHGLHYYLAILAAFCAWPAGNLFLYEIEIFQNSLFFIYK